MSGRYDFSLRQGNDFQRGFRFRGADRALVDLTGSILELSVWTGVEKVHRFRLAVTDPASGEAVLSMRPDETRALPVGPCQYELERRFERPGTETTLMTGVIVVERGITYDR